MSPNELVPMGENLPEKMDPELKAAIQADMEVARKEADEATEFKPPLIKIGKASWLIGEGEKPVVDFEAIVFCVVKCNAYWHDADDVKNPILLDDYPEDYERGGKIPLCSSVGCVYGIRDSVSASSDGTVVKCFGNCGSGKIDTKKYSASTESGDCYLNCFGTSVGDSGQRGRGKACKNMRRMLLLVKGERHPHLLTLPPTSIGNFDAYCRFIESNQSLSYVYTKFALNKADDGGAMTWYVFSKEAAISGWSALGDDMYQRVYEAREKYKDLLGRVEITEEEYKTEDAEEVEAEDVTDQPQGDKAARPDEKFF